LEKLKKQGLEVLFMVDPNDEYVGRVVARGFGSLMFLFFHDLNPMFWVLDFRATCIFTLEGYCFWEPSGGLRIGPSAETLKSFVESLV